MVILCYMNLGYNTMISVQLQEALFLKHIPKRFYGLKCVFPIDFI